MMECTIDTGYDTVTKESYRVIWAKKIRMLFTSKNEESAFKKDEWMREDF